MFQKHLWRLFVAVLTVTGGCGFAMAQDPKPLSQTGGFARSELDSIYRQGVGRGYTGASLNQIALRSDQARVGNYGQTTATSGGGRIGLGVGASQLNKPFSSFTPSPTTSPYLNLFREDLDGNSDLNYNTLVRPMLQQQQFNQQLQRQSLELAQRLQAISAQTDYNPQGSKQQVPTGHQTVFGYYGHYYPANARGRR